METCQRWISVGIGSCHGMSFSDAAEVYWGEKAFLFLLRLATGLESEIVGETDIFGQLKGAWRKFEDLDIPLKYALAPWFQRLFADTKEIRTQFLQNLGGTSYGSLVRKLIKEKGGDQGPILIAGAGQIAKSIAPFLLDYDLLLWNRSQARLNEFTKDLQSRIRSGASGSLTVVKDEKQGWSVARTIVICTPLDPQSDAHKVEWLKQRQEKVAIIHLGAMRDALNGSQSVWNSLSHCFCLDDLFELKNSMSQVRSLQVAQAVRACENRARQRNKDENEVKIGNTKIPTRMVPEYVGCETNRTAESWA